MAETALKRLLDMLVRRVNSRNLRPVFYELLDALDGCFFLFEITGEDGGIWLYKVSNSKMMEKKLSKTEGFGFDRQNLFIMEPPWTLRDLPYLFISIPSGTLYDLLLKDITPVEAAAHAEWGGSVDVHPTWTRLKAERFFEMIGLAVNSFEY